jgi:hypothetical protein
MEKTFVLRRWKPIFIYTMRRANVIAVRYMWPGTRVGAGALFMVGGVFGFLPILGFWMFPVGMFVAASEFPPARRPMQRWLYREKRTLTLYERLNPKEASRPKK